MGSETQAQLAVQVAHDKNNVYFLLSRTDETVGEGDGIKLAVNGSKTVTVNADGSFTAGDHSGKGAVTVHEGEGALFELAVPKSALGIAGAASFTLCPTLIETVDGKTVTDTLTNGATVGYHPRVVLN